MICKTELKERQRVLTMRAMSRNLGSRTEAAHDLGISQRNLYLRLARYETEYLRAELEDIANGSYTPNESGLVKARDEINELE